MWKTFLKELSEIFFPQKCIICQKDGEIFCDDCMHLSDISNQQYCPFCSLPQISKNGARCAKHKKYLDGLYCPCDYKNKIINTAIKKFKYEPGLKELAMPLAKIIDMHLDYISKNKNDFSEFILIPVPISKQKMKTREFNQSAELAKELAKIFKIPVYNTLQRAKNTAPQAQLNRNDRLKNIENAFLIDKNKIDIVKNKDILLIDDIFTTGSTCEECAKILKTAGAKSVWAMTIARESLN